MAILGRGGGGFPENNVKTWFWSWYDITRSKKVEIQNYTQWKTLRKWESSHILYPLTFIGNVANISNELQCYQLLHDNLIEIIIIHYTCTGREWGLQE